MVSVPESFVVAKFFQFVGGPKHNKYQNTYSGSCPVCREGKSWLKKKRCYYLPKKNVICCHNCGWYGTPFAWIKEVAGLESYELIREIKKFDGVVVEISKKENKPTIQTTSLPQDSINLRSGDEIKFWNDNFIVQKALELIKTRKLDTAINAPKALFTSLNDPVHKNRLTIPFYNSKDEIVFYQSRRILTTDSKPKYLSKMGAEKSLFGLNSVRSDIDTVFLTEGPIDAFFIKNGLAVAGITQSANIDYTDTQQQQLKELFLYKKVWVLDNQFLDQASKTKTKRLLEAGHNVFIWPNKEYKDLNELCIAKNINEIETSFILENTYTKLKGLIKLSS